MESELKNTGKKRFWDFIEGFKGDKVIWMIVLLLMLISLVTIFSSTSAIAVGDNTRLDIFVSQFKLVCVGLGIILICYNIPKISFIRKVSKWGFVVSAGLLLCLLTGFHAEEINGAVRALNIGGLQLHVFEAVKVAMVMYVAWAINTYRKDSFTFLNLLADNYEKLSWLQKPFCKRLLYIYLPILIVLALMFKGGISSTLFVGVLMFVTILIGGMPKKEIFGAVLIGIAMIGLFVGIWYVSDGKVFKRIGTGINRLTLNQEYDVIRHGDPKSIDYREAIDKLRQPVGAKIAVKDGGLMGKGPGNSTQKYMIFAMFSDYMFSFIIEEYGLIGGIVVVLLYLSLVARGRIIVRLCDSVFAKTAVSGLVLLISGQAFMHMLINVDIGPLSGQTLPMISHGKSSFLCFSIAFGILLSISRMAKEKEERRKEEEESAAMEMETELQEGLETETTQQ